MCTRTGTPYGPGGARAPGVGSTGTAGSAALAVRVAGLPRGRAGAPGEAGPPARFGNPLLSWLDFNERVLALAGDGGLPLRERLRFLAIFAANLDRFYAVRVARLRRAHAAGLPVTSPDGMPAGELLARVAARVRDLAARHARCFGGELRPALRRQGVHLVGWERLGGAERSRLDTYARRRVLPLLVPLRVDPTRPLPGGPSLHLAVAVRGGPAGSPPHLVAVGIPDRLPRLVAVGPSGVDGPPAGPRVAFLPLEDLVAAHLDLLLPGVRVTAHRAFRVTRSAELDVTASGDRTRALARAVAGRGSAPAVRLEVDAAAPSDLLDPLLPALGLDRADVFRVTGPLDLAGLAPLWRVDPAQAVAAPPASGGRSRPAGTDTGDVFAALRRGDVLVHHPYDPFAASVQRLLDRAADDPDVLAVRQTLYRTCDRSPVVEALVRAARAGKQVLAVVELAARFDERANIRWARALERAGCRVVHGPPDLKTHGKVTLVLRREGGALRRYSHVGTGNYNPLTARSYEDLGLLTADPEIGADLAGLFDTLAGSPPPAAYRRLLVSPGGVRHGLLTRVDREVANAARGLAARIRIKVNALVDPDVVDALYRASGAGVDVDLLVRGSCVLRPGVPGLSERIRVRSVVGRFLEHSRVYCFHNGGDPEAWIGSADLAPRNLDRRVEVLVRVGAGDALAYLSALLERAFAADLGCWELSARGWARTGGGAGLQDALAALRRPGGR